MDDEFDRIIDIVTAACDSARSSEWLSSIPVGPDAYRGTDQAERLVMNLKEAFTGHQLMAAGVVQPRDRVVKLRGDFASGDCEFVVLRDAAGRAFDVVTATGCLRQQGPALLAVVRDAAFLAALRDTKLFF